MGLMYSEDTLYIKTKILVSGRGCIFLLIYMIKIEKIIKWSVFKQNLKFNIKI